MTERRGDEGLNREGFDPARRADDGARAPSPAAVTERWEADEATDRRSSARPTGRGPRSRRRRRLPRLKTLLVSLLIALPLAALAGAAYATYDYSEEYKGKILPGATIAGVDVGGMNRAEALRAVRKALRPQMHREVTVRWRHRSWTVTPAQLGARNDARTAVEAALAESSDAGMLDKAQMKLLGKDLDFREDVALRYPRRGAFAFIEGLASEFDLEPRDASIDYSSGWVEIVPERAGREVNTKKSGRALLAALRSGARVARLNVKVLKPEVTREAYDQVLLLRQSDYELHLYQDGKITHTYTVAVGQPAYPTPTGLYEVTLKRYMPTWINPDPEGWGASMPDMIPPGPSNPLGLRALNWDASGIRFHGTSNIGSLGTAASHGCVRLSNDDVIELYDLVDVGTPIVSIY